jgi:hypothetical protein
LIKENKDKNYVLQRVNGRDISKDTKKIQNIVAELIKEDSMQSKSTMELRLY